MDISLVDDLLIKALAEELNQGLHYSVGYTCGTSAPIVAPTEITPDKIKNALEQVTSHIDPLAKYMREQGFNPDSGGRLAIPSCVAANLLVGTLPDYVTVNQYIEKPVLYRYTRKPLRSSHED